MTFNRLIKIASVIVVFGCNYVYGQSIDSLSALDRQLVQDACKNIDLKLSNKTGTLDRVACSYKKTSPQRLEAAIDYIYADYRKEAESKKYAFKSAIDLTKCNSDEITKIIYKSSEKRQVTVVKYKHGRRSSCITVAIAQA